MKFKSTLVGLFALVLVAGAAALTYYSYASKQGEAKALPTAQSADKAYLATPVFVKQNPESTLLKNGENVLYAFNLGTQNGKVITFKQIVLKIQRSADTQLSNFKLFRNSKEVPGQDYSITEGTTGLDLTVGVADTSDKYLIAVVSLTTEDVLYGTGNTYSLKATAKSDLLKSSYVMTSVYRGNDSVVKGYLTNAKVQPFTAASQNIFSIKKTTDSSTAVPGYFIWSDKSATKHTASVASLSSNDWLSDYDDGSLEAQPTTIATK